MTSGLNKPSGTVSTKKKAAKGFKDRTPSFYTTPEGILYGGLSVADPAPVNNFSPAASSHVSDSELSRNDVGGGIMVDQSNYEMHLNNNLKASQSVESRRDRGFSFSSAVDIENDGNLGDLDGHESPLPDEPESPPPTFKK